MDSNQVPGSAILADVRAAYDRYRRLVAAHHRRAVVIRFAAAQEDPPRWQARMEASHISARQKIRTLAWLGVDAREVVLPGSVAEHEFAALIARANSDPAMTAVIVQLPAPERLRDLVHDIAPGKDIDALLGERSPYPACATADGVARLVVAHAPVSSPVAVVGARGFVGVGVTRLLRAQGREVIALDVGDDLSRVHDADVVVAATGSPGVLGREHLRPYHRLVVDTGFVPQPDGSIAGDVRRDAYPIPQRITPVPGGIGPVEMAVLLERVVAKEADPGLAPWRIDPQTMRAHIPNLREPTPQADQGVPGREPRHTVPSGEPSGPQLVAFFGVLYYSGVRPEEAIGLRRQDVELPDLVGDEIARQWQEPDDCWGELHLRAARPDVGKQWTDDGSDRDHRGLKHRAEGESRRVPCPPALTKLLRQHLAEFNGGPADPLFQGVQGRPLATITYRRVWDRARKAVLAAEEYRSPLARRPYDLRHACLSTWLNGGVAVTQVAEWAGHSVEMLLRVYAKCLDGQDEIAKRRIAAALADVEE